MATKGAFKRLTKEYLNIMKNPPPFIIAKPLESNILEWYDYNFKNEKSLSDILKK